MRISTLISTFAQLKLNKLKQTTQHLRSISANRLVTLTALTLTSLSLGAYSANSQAANSDKDIPKAMKTAAHQADINAFIDDMVNEHQFDRAQLQTLLNNAKPNQTIIEAINRPWEAKPWFKYHPIFLTEKRIDKGVEFWNKHQATLERAEQELGVPAEIIVAIIGVETYYGTYKGKYQVLDALYTLGFYHPPRAKFFRKELGEFFILSREENLPLTDIYGSYAGAMGWGQFISSSYRHYAIDFDNDGQRDLLNNPVDAIGSVANYFKKHGWKHHEPVAFPASVSGATFPEYLSKDLKYKHTWQELQQAGVSSPQTQAANIKGNAPAKLLEFDAQTIGTNSQVKEYWVGLHNFYVITRYNHSPLYAMAVYQLSQEIKRRK